MDKPESGKVYRIQRAGDVPALSNGNTWTESEVRDREDRAAIAQGLRDEVEFEAWWIQEVELSTPTLRNCAAPIHSIARDAFRQGLALGREGRA